MKYIISGGCGFIGRNFVHYLLSNGTGLRDIAVIDNFSVGTIEDLSAVGRVRLSQRSEWTENAITLFEADIRDAGAMMRYVRQADVLVHLAACTGVVPAMKDPQFDCETNVRGTLNVLEACRHNGVGRLVFASSGAPLGHVGPPVHEELPAHPISPYGASKLAGEGYCSAYFHGYGLETVALRFGNVFGPFSGHKISVVAAFISRALRGEPLPLHGGGSATRDFIYTKDLCDAIFRAATSAGIGGEVFQISPGKEVSIAEMTALLIEVLKESGIENVVVQNAPVRPVDILRSFANVSKAEKRLGWKAKHSLREGLQETLQWFLQRDEKAGKAESAA